MINRLMVLLALATLASGAGSVSAQGTFPAPLPGQAAAPMDGAAPKAIIGGTSPFSPGGVASSVLSPCMKDFAPLREDAEKKGKLIKAAGDRHAGPSEACKLIKDYSAAEVRTIKYIENNSAKCGIPAQVADQLKAGHKNTEGLEKKVCDIAEQLKERGTVGPSLNDVIGLTEVRSQQRGPVGDFGGREIGR